MSDRVAVINHGKLVQLDAPRQIYDHPATPFVANFIGESTLLTVEYVDGRACYDGTPLQLPASDAAPDATRDSLLMLRPERLVLLPDGASADYNCFRGTVDDVVYQGESFVVYVTLRDGAEVAVRGVSQRQALAAAPALGSDITLGLHADETVLIPRTENGVSDAADHADAP